MNNRNLGTLKGSERVRKRVNNMFGSDGAKGVSHSLFEIISNSVDRFKKGYGKKVIITRYSDNSLSVEDFADGLPMEWNEEEGAYNWDIALKTLYGGDNYEQSQSNDGVLGANGLGLTSTQYTSEYMDVIVYKNNKKYTTKFKKGRPLDFETGEYVGKDDNNFLSKEDGARVLKIESYHEDRSGTFIKFKPDGEVFTTTCIESEWIKDKLNKQAVVNTGISIDYNDELECKTYTYNYDKITDYIDCLSSGNENRIDNVLYFTGSGKGKDKEDRPEYETSYEIAFAFDNLIGVQEYYHNSSELIELSDNATTKGFEKALTSSLHKIINENKLYKAKEKKIKIDDILPSLVSIVNTKSTLTSYSNQTKYSINNIFIEDFILKNLEEQLNIYFTENKDYALKVASRVLINKRAREHAETTRLNIRKKLENDGSLLSKAVGLIDCKSKNPLENELYICEGRSALGSLIKARDSQYQACIPVRGKTLNCLKADLKKILSNDTIINIIKAFGCGIEVETNKKDFNSFDISKLRYGKIILASDGDVDGFQIRTLILTMIYKLCPKLIEEGYVYIVEAPLYEAVKEKSKVIDYLYTEEEKNDYLEKNKNKKVDISRNKGLGEMSPEAMSYSMMNKDTRRLIQITVEDLKEADEMFELFLGENIKPRKDYILKNYDKFSSKN